MTILNEHDPLSVLAKAHAVFTGEPMGIVDLLAGEVTEWAIPTVENHESAEIHPGDLPTFIAACDRALKGEELIRLDLRMRPTGPKMVYPHPDYWVDVDCTLAFVERIKTTPTALLQVVGPCQTNPGKPKLSL